jgi:hypothetical protein
MRRRMVPSVPGAMLPSGGGITRRQQGANYHDHQNSTF